MAVTIDTLKAATRLREEGGLRRAAGDRPGSDVRRFGGAVGAGIGILVVVDNCSDADR